ncbi:MAG: hypothetical protein P8Z37_08990 [Acidobacteriota bacterium]
MKKYGIFLCILLLPDTLLCADYFFAANCTGLTDIHGSVDQNRLSSCVNELINGINRTRQAIDSKNNETLKKVDEVNYNVKSMNLIIRDLANDSSKNMKTETDADPAINAIIAKMEERDRELEKKIKQLETKIAVLEKSLGETQPAKPTTGK